MQIKPEQLAATLDRQTCPLVWVAGDEPLLCQECCDTVRQYARDQGFGEREVMHAGADFAWHDLLQSANSLSLFSEQKLIDLRLSAGKLDTEGREALRHYLEDPPADTLLLMSSPRIDKPTQNTKWFKAIEASAVFVQVWPVKPGELPGWLNQRLQRLGLSADREALELLAERVEGNLLAATQELEKLAILANAAHLDARLVSQTVADSARYDVFGMIDACMLGNAARGMRMLDHLRADGTEALMVLNFLCKEIRQLAAMRRDLEDGKNINAVIQSHRVWFNRKSAVTQALGRHSPASLSALLDIGWEVDQCVKGMATGSPWDLLADIGLGLAGVKTACQPA